MDPQEKLHQDIKKFLEVYKVLLPEGKARFKAQLAGAIKKEDEKTKKLYQILLRAAKDGLGIEEAIQRMNES